MAESVRIVITADPSQAQAGLGKIDQALNKTAAGAKVSAAQTAAAMRTIPAQLTDVVTQLQGGGNPLTVLLQQGGQLKDSFGGVRPALQGLGETIGPMLTNPVTLAGVAVTGLVASLLAGQAQAAELQRAFALTGNAAGLTAGQVDQLSQRLAASGAISIGAARDLTQALVAAGVLSGQALESAASAAAQLSRLSGRSAEDVAKDFAGIGDNVTAFAQRANKAYNFLTAAQFDQIRSLQAQGDAQGAAKLTLDALSDSLEQRTAPSLGLIDRLLKTGATTWSSWWDAAKGIGRAETVEEQLAKVGARVDAISKRRKKDAEDLAAMTGLPVDAPTQQGNLTALEDASRSALLRLSAAQQQAAAFGQQAARADAANAERNQREIEERSAGHQQALASIAKAGASRRLAENSLSLGTARAIYDSAFTREEITAREHAAALQAIDLARLDAEEANLDRLKGIEARRQISSPDDRLNQQAALTAFEAQRLGIQERRVALQLKEAEAVKVNDRGVNLFAGGDDSAEILRRVQASRDAQQQLADQAEQFRAYQIQDAEVRGRALIAIEERTLRKRLDLEALGDDARRQAEDGLVDYIAARNADLTERLKPEWQRMVEGWQDANHLMREANDALMTGLVRNGEDAFVEFAKTGKLNIRSLVDDVLTEMARLQYRQILGSISSSSEDNTGLYISLLNMGLRNLIGGDISLSGSGGAMGGDLMGSGSSNFGAGGLLGAGRADGGPVYPNTLHPVNERKVPELLNVAGRQFLMMGNNGGSVTPLDRMVGASAPASSAASSSGAGGMSLTVSPVINIDARTDRAQVQQLVSQGVQQAVSQAVSRVADLRSRGNRAFT